MIQEELQELLLEFTDTNCNNANNSSLNTTNSFLSTDGSDVSQSPESSDTRKNESLTSSAFVSGIGNIYVLNYIFQRYKYCLLN